MRTGFAFTIPLPTESESQQLFARRLKAWIAQIIPTLKHDIVNIRREKSGMRAFIKKTILSDNSVIIYNAV